MYNFWQDKTNVLGLWRRTAVASYKTEKPEWETIIDFDQLAAKEGVRWVFSGSSRLYPDFSRCLLSMSPDGGDASEMREFDIETKSIVEGGFSYRLEIGFRLAGPGTVVVSAAFEEEDKTESGYPRVVKLWKRGTRVEDVTSIFEAQKQDLAAGAGVSSMATNGLWSWPERSLLCLSPFVRLPSPAKTGAFHCRTVSPTRDLQGSACLRRAQPMDGARRYAVPA